MSANVKGKSNNPYVISLLAEKILELNAKLEIIQKNEQEIKNPENSIKIEFARKLLKDRIENIQAILDNIIHVNK